MLLLLVHTFVNTFGITQPTPSGARRAARLLGWALLAITPGLAWLASVLVHVISRRP